MKKKMKFASRKYNRNLSGSHYSTIGFGEVLPAWANEQVIGDQVTIKPSVFARSAPQVLPNMANLSLSNRAFFCTYNSVWRYYEEFRQGNPVNLANSSTKVIISTTPTISRALFLRVLTDNFNTRVNSTTSVFSDCVAISPVTAVTSDPWDFSLVIPSTTSGRTSEVAYYRLTRKGKQVLKIFQALDYNFNFAIPYSGDVSWDNVNYTVDRLSALPLLCFFKVMFDYYLPSNLRPSSYICNFLYWVNNLWTQTSPDLDYTLLVYSFEDVSLYHDSNYFTSQWLSPTEPAPYLSQFGTLVANDFNIQGNSYGNTELSDPERPSAYYDSNSNFADGQIVGLTDAGGEVPSNSITYDQIKVINQLRSFIMRNNLVGSLPLQRLFARYGVKVPELQLQMSQYFGNYDVAVETSAVVSTNGNLNNDSEDSSLGDLGGMSYINQKKDHSFKFTCSQDGMSFIIASLDVPSSYVSGIGRHLYHRTPFSFYTPEFDDSIMQATRGNELVGRIVGLSETRLIEVLSPKNLTSQSVFGYVPRYSELKYGKNRISGDYNVKTLRNPIIGYILPRQVYDEESLMSLVDTTSLSEISNSDVDKHFYYGEYDPTSVIKESDAVQFNRIYRDIDGLADPFCLEFTFDVNCFGAVKPNDLDMFIDGNGDTFEFQVNGGHLN